MTAVNSFGLQTLGTKTLIGRHILRPVLFTLVNSRYRFTLGGGGVRPNLNPCNLAAETTFNIQIWMLLSMLQCNPRIQQPAGLLLLVLLIDGYDHRGR